MLYIVHESATRPSLSPSNSMPLGWKGSTTSGFQTISVGATGSSTEEDRYVRKVAFARGRQRSVERHAVGIDIAAPFREAFRSRLGPIVWLLEGPLPIL